MSPCRPARSPAQPAAGTREVRVELAVDWTRCDGHGLCATLLPGTIELDDWGYPVVDADAVSTARTRDLRRAVSVCPAIALRIDRRAP